MAFCSLWFWHPNYCPQGNQSVSSHPQGVSSLSLLRFQKACLKSDFQRVTAGGNMNNWGQYRPLRPSALGIVTNLFPKLVIVSLQLKPGSRSYQFKRKWERQLFWTLKESRQWKFNGYIQNIPKHLKRNFFSPWKKTYVIIRIVGMQKLALCFCNNILGWPNN